MRLEGHLPHWTAKRDLQRRLLSSQWSAPRGLTGRQRHCPHPRLLSDHSLTHLPPLRTDSNSVCLPPWLCPCGGWAPLISHFLVCVYVLGMELRAVCISMLCYWHTLQS
jgi:hypothetical protein